MTTRIATETGVWEMPDSAEQNDPRWRDAYFANRLADVTARFIYGCELTALKPLLRADLRSFAESYTDDSVKRYASVLNALEGQ